MKVSLLPLCQLIQSQSMRLLSSGRNPVLIRTVTTSDSRVGPLSQPVRPLQVSAAARYAISSSFVTTYSELAAEFATHRQSNNGENELAISTVNASIRVLESLEITAEVCAP